MGCSCSKISNSVVSTDRDSRRLSKIRDNVDILNTGFVGIDRDNTYEISVRLQNMFLSEKDNMVDASCYVAIYESRKMGKANKRNYVLVGTTETILHEPNPEFIKRIPLTNKDQDIKFEVYECNNSKHQNKMNTNPMIGVFECNMKDLVNNKGYYTTPLSPVSVPMFGSIQIYAEPIQEDRGSTILSLSFTNLKMNPANPYLVISRINENGVRIPLYKSHILNKAVLGSTRSLSPESSDDVNETPASSRKVLMEEDDSLLVSNITFDNQTLLNFEKNCQLSFELWDSNRHTRDLFIGSLVIPGQSINTLYEGEQRLLAYNYQAMTSQRQADCVVAKSNWSRMGAFKEYMEKHVNSISACSLDPERMEELKEAENTLLVPAYLQDQSMEDREEVGVLRVERITTTFINSFYDYQSITSLDFIIGVDMSSSVKQSSTRDVEEALVDIGTVASRYDDDDCYCVYGFGCHPDETVIRSEKVNNVQIPEVEESMELELPGPLEEMVITDLSPLAEEEPSPQTSRSSSFHSIVSSEDLDLNEIPDEIPLEEVKGEEIKGEEIEVEEIEVEEMKVEEEIRAEDVKGEEEMKAEEMKVEEMKTEKVDEEKQVEDKSEEEFVDVQEIKLDNIVLDDVKPDETPATSFSNPLLTSTLTKEEESLYRSQLFKSQQEADSLKRRRAESILRSRLALLKSQASPSSPKEQSLESQQLDIPIFPLNGNSEDPFIHSVDSILSCYREAVAHSTPSYPTYFQHILQKGIDRAREAEKTNGKEYIVLVVVSDCCIVDQVETARLIVEASDLPLSLIIVGIGENDFHFMEQLDGDAQILSYRGKVASRDIVQFVPFEELRYKSCEEIISELISELPRQFMDYMNSRGYTPENIL